METTTTNADEAALIEQLDPLLGGNWTRDGDAFDYMSLGAQGLLITVDDVSITVHEQIRGLEAGSATFTGTQAAQRAAAYARSIAD